MALKPIPVIYLHLVVVILCIITHHHLVSSIPIDIFNNNPQARHHQPNHFHQHQQANKPMESEGAGRLHPNNNRLRRQSAAPADIKPAPGNFQQNQPESFVKANGGSPVYHRHEDSQQSRSNNFRHQSPPSAYSGPVDAQETRHGRYPPSQQNFLSQGPPPARTYNPHPEENRGKHVPNSFESHIYQSEKIPRDDQKYSKPYPMNYKNPFPEKPSPNFLPPLTHRQPAPTVALVVVGVNGNSTLFIEYDVSDNDVTYETIMEVEEGSDPPNFESNDLK